MKHHQAFDRDVFRVRAVHRDDTTTSSLGAVTERYEVRDGDGTLLLLATTPTRFVRLILAVVGGALAGSVCMVACGMLLHAWQPALSAAQT